MDKKIIFERAAALSGIPGQQIPACTPEVLEKAGQIASGVVFFYQRTPVPVGLTGIDWSGGHIHHQEWPAQLNRFFHLLPLASAYRETKDERYALAARAYIADWIAHGGSYEDGATAMRPGDNTLTLSIRLGQSIFPGWAGTLPVFLASPHFDDIFVGKMLASLASQAAFLARHLTAAASNWRISQLDALVFTALRFPFLANAAELLKTGITGMRNALATQFLQDGVHIERTPGYHDWMTRVAVCYQEVAKLFPEANCHVNRDIISKASEFGRQAKLFGVNDSIAPHRDPVSAAEPNAPPLEQVFPVAGHVFARSGWEAGADYLAFDAGSWGGGHGHLSRLSFVFRSGGRMLVADPGILTYEMSNPFAAYGKSTPAHSTLNLNGWSQSEADAKLHRAEFSPRTALIQASYQGGYWDGPYFWNWPRGRGNGAFGLHDRIVYWVKGEYLLALDTMRTESDADIRNVWQLGPMEQWQIDPASFKWWSTNADVNLSVQLIQPPAGTQMDCWEGSREPLRGWVGWHGDDAVPAPQVEFRYPCPATRRATTAILITPFRGKEGPDYSVESTQTGPIHHLQIRLPDGSRDCIAWTPDLTQAIDDGQPFVTDASFVWLRLSQAGQPVQSFVLDGSYLHCESQTVFARPQQKSAWCMHGKTPM